MHKAMNKNNQFDGKLNLKIDTYFIYAFIVTMILAVLGDIKNAVLSIIALILMLPLISKPRYLLGPLFFTTVFEDFLIAFEGQSFSRFLSIYLIIGIMVHEFLNRQNMRISGRSVSIIALMMMGVVFSTYGLLGYTSIPYTYIFSLSLALMLMNFNAVSSTELVNDLFNYSVLSILYIVWMIFANGLNALELGQRASIASVNANQVAIGIAVAFSIIFTHFLLNNFRYKVVHCVLMVNSLTCLFLTGSRTSVIACIVSTALIFLIRFFKYDSPQYGRKYLKFSIVLFITLGIFVILFNYLSLRFPVLMNRFTIDSVADTGGTGRLFIWQAYFYNYFPTYWLFGIGFDPLNMYYAIERVSFVGHGAHNFIIDILSSTGLFGLTVYFLCFVNWIQDIHKNSRKNVDLIVPLGMIICLLCVGIGENLIRSKMFWLAFGFGFTMLNSKETTVKIKCLK